MKNRSVKYLGKLKHKRIIILSLFGLLGLSMIGTQSYLKTKATTISNQLFEQELEILFQNELEQKIRQKADDMEIGRIKESQYYVFVSKSENEKLVAQLKKQTHKATHRLENIPSVVLSYISDERVSDNLIHRKLVIKEYYWQVENHSFSKEKEESEIAEILVADSMRPVKLEDMVIDDTSLRAITRIMQETILREHDQSETIIKEVLSLPDLTFDSDVVLFPQSLKINLDSDQVGLESISIEYTEIYPHINPAFLDSSFMEDKKNEESKKRVALTFDDGPNTTSTVRLLELLERESIEATFFLLGQMVTNNPHIAKRIAEQGHEVANHSYSHPDLTQRTTDEVKSEVTKTDEAIFLATGVLPKTFRPPYGAVNRDVISKVGLPIIQWDVDSLDWKFKNPEIISKKVIAQAQEGSIILLHDIHESSVEAVPKIIQGLKNEGYEFVTVSELLNYEQKPFYEYFSEHHYLKNK